MTEIIKQGIQNPTENSGGASSEAIIVRGTIRVPGSDFDHRPDVGSGPAYLGPSKMSDRSSAISSGVGQKKKHKSTGKGQ